LIFHPVSNSQENIEHGSKKMKNFGILVVTFFGTLGAAHAGNTVVAGPVTTASTSLDPVHDVLLCSATNLSNEERILRYAIVEQDGSLVGAPSEEAVSALETTSVGDFAVLCVWEVEGNPEAWRFTACVASSMNFLGCTGGFVEGRVAPGMKFPEQ
jgi:hypothetical protein